MTKQTELSPEQRSKMLDMIREGTNLEMSKRLLELEAENRQLRSNIYYSLKVCDQIKKNGRNNDHDIDEIEITLMSAEQLFHGIIPFEEENKKLKEKLEIAKV